VWLTSIQSYGRAKSEPAKTSRVLNGSNGLPLFSSGAIRTPVAYAIRKRDGGTASLSSKEICNSRFDNQDGENGQNKLSSPPPRLLHEPVQPFNSKPLHPMRRAGNSPGDKVERTTNSNRDSNVCRRKRIEISFDPRGLATPAVRNREHFRATRANAVERGRIISRICRTL
jgi:hypothetical protein